MSTEQSGERGFVVVDKRGEDKEAPAQPGPEPALPTPDFASLVISLGHSALFHLGLVADPQTGRKGEKDVALARQTIDLVAMLQEKTRGNLTADEARLVEDLLYDLRARFVEAAK